MDLDRISALPDDLLHLILASVGDAVSVTRTAVLSRRWRRVWTQTQRLVLVDRKGIGQGSFADFVDWVFAQRGDADIGSLYIHYPGKCFVPGRLNQCLRYAMQCVVKSLDIAATGNIKNLLKNNNEPPVEMPGHRRMSRISMGLHYYRLQLPMPAAAKYEALTELAISLTTFHEEEEEEHGGVRTTTLGDFVSTCCPRLRKLELQFPVKLRKLVLRTKTLEELILYFADDLGTLDVAAPNLRVLRLLCCTQGSVVNVSAKKLEEVAVHLLWDVTIDIRDLTNVRCLGPIDVYMHGQHLGPDGGAGLWLLENCPGAQHIKLSLEHWEASDVTDDDLVDYLEPSQGAPLATFANVRTMEVTVTANEFPEGHLVPSMSSLLLRFPHLRSLCVKLLKSNNSRNSSWRWNCLCSGLDTWIGSQKISLESLETVKIDGFMGADEDIDLVCLLLASSDSIKSMIVLWEWTKIKTSNATTNAPATISLKRMMEEGDNNGTKTIYQKLINIPSTNRGHWHFKKGVYTWVVENATPVSGKGSPANPT